MLDEIVQTRRNTKAAKRLLTRLLKKQGMPPKPMITDKLRSDGAAKHQKRRLGLTWPHSNNVTTPIREPAAQSSPNKGRPHRKRQQTEQ